MSLDLADPQTWSVHTDVFDGPLDLLLYLVRRDGIDLRNLAITPIADAYLQYVERMRELHLGVAGEYLVMAATLVYLKSLELLPRRPTSVEEDEDVEDPREALARRLIEYERYRAAAAELDARPLLGRDSFARAPEQEDESTRPPSTDIDAFGLLELYYGLLVKADTTEPEHVIFEAGVDFESCCRRVLGWLGGPGGQGDLAQLLGGLATVPERVVSFIAVLEMSRLQWLDLVQDFHLGPVHLTSRVEADHDLAQLTGRLDVPA